MKTILTPVDFSPATRAVIHESAELAAKIGARVILLHSIQTPMITTDYGMTAEALQEAVAISEKASAQQLKHQQALLQKKGMVVDVIQETGVPAKTILEHAKTVKADYIVLGSHGHTAFYDLLVGSTTQAVIKKAPCPVIIVPPAVATPTKRKR